MGRLRVLRVWRPGPKTSAILPSLTKAAISRLAHGELPPFSISMVLHGIAPGEDARFGLIPLNDVDELLAEKLERLIGFSFGDGSRWSGGRP